MSPPTAEGGTPGRTTRSGKGAGKHLTTQRKLPLRPIHKTRLVDDVTNQLREWILTGELAPGTHLLQVELAEQFGVSRTPLREAFRVLERDGLIRMANGNKTLEVVAPTTAEILDMYALREWIDGFAASLLAASGLPPDLERQLSADVEGMDEAIPEVDLSSYGAFHTNFHTAIVENCGNRSVLELLPLVRMSSQMMVSRHFTETTGVANMSDTMRRVMVDVLSEGNRHHRAILEAIRARDAPAAESQARRHIRRGMRGVDALRAESELSAGRKPPAAVAAVPTVAT